MIPIRITEQVVRTRRAPERSVPEQNLPCLGYVHMDLQKFEQDWSQLTGVAGNNIRVDDL